MLNLLIMQGVIKDILLVAGSVIIMGSPVSFALLLYDRPFADRQIHNRSPSLKCLATRSLSLALLSSR